MSHADAHARHRLLCQAHDDALITYDAAASSDETYRVRTAEGEVLAVSASQVAAFCSGLMAGFTAAQGTAQLDAALREVGVGAPARGQCRHCQAPLASAGVTRCPVCARSQVHTPGG